MLSLFAYALLLAFLRVAMCASVEEASSAACPGSCNEADEWCSKTFAQGGEVSSRNCDASSFECVCNGVSAIRVTNAGDEKCSWSASFEDVDVNGSFCFPHTALCPESCYHVSAWSVNCVEDTLCVPGEDGFNFTCTTCKGRTYSIAGNGETCTKQIYGDVPSCDPITSCNGHGCCRKPGTAGDTCLCYRDPVNGFWAQPSCLTCDAAYDPNKGGCTRPRTVIQIILSSIGSTWTMVLPNLTVLFLFVVLGLVRSECESDKSFQTTALRQTGLSAVQVARRNQRSLFHSKYIPKRPVQSKCFLNEVENFRRASSIHLHTDTSVTSHTEKT